MGRMPFLVAVLASMPLGLLALRRPRATGVQDTMSMGEKQGFVGSWRMTFCEAAGPPTLGLATFGADGTVVTAEHPVVTPPVAAGAVFTSSGHGVWQSIAPDAAVVTFIGLGSLGQGILFGTATAHASIRLGPDGQTFRGDVVWTVADPSGTLLATYPGTFQATRIVIEAPELPTAAAQTT
jgi:hypothetical protein